MRSAIRTAAANSDQPAPTVPLRPDLPPRPSVPLSPGRVETAEPATPSVEPQPAPDRNGA